MVERFSDWNFWLSIITISAAIVALFQTSKQIKVSNRQQLFDGRLEKYLTLKELLSLYSQHRTLIENERDFARIVSYDFAWFTNCSFLEEMNGVMNNPLHKEEQKIFLSKCEILNKAALEIELLWNNEEGKLAAQFIKQYSELLKSMYRQHIYLYSLEKEKSENPMPFDVVEKRIKDSAESVGLFSIRDKIGDTFAKIVSSKVEQHLIESMRL